jgi:hypothetical protein
MALLTEAVVRVGFDRISSIQRRTVTEFRAATSPNQPGHPTALFIGNSLLDEGVQFATIHDALSPAWDARRFVVEQTYYNDWYYGLRRLFRDGARPDVVVLVLTPRQWIRDDIRGDYSAQYLMTTADAIRATRELHMHSTEAASFVLASVSKFWGARAEIRNFLLGRLMPDLGTLMNFSSVVDPTVLHDDDVERAAYEPLQRSRDLAERYGARLVALIPPILDPVDGAAGLERAGRRAGVLVIDPVASGTYPASFYRDAGFHLNATGRSDYTAALAPALRRIFSGMAQRAHTAAAPVSGSAGAAISAQGGPVRPRNLPVH